MFVARYNAAISRNHVRLTNTATGETLAKTSLRAFSSDDCVVADYQGALAFVGELFRELEGPKRWLRIWSTIDVALTEKLNFEKDSAAVAELFTEHGFARVRVT